MADYKKGGGSVWKIQKNIIKYYLYESEIFTEKEINSLNTDSINDSIRKVATAILGAIVEKN